MRLLKFLAIVFLFTVLIYNNANVLAVECGDELPKDKQALEEYITSCNTKLNELQGKKKTLSSTIAYLNSQISLTQGKIAQTQSLLNTLYLEIEDLSNKIQNLNYSLDDLTKVFLIRTRESYKTQLLLQKGGIIAHTKNLSRLLLTLEYLKKAREHDRQLLLQLERSRLTYDEQKNLKEKKTHEIEALQTKLKSQKQLLAQQKHQQEVLLTTTKNNEKTYQQLLAKAQAELAAIKAVIAGQGNEIQVREVKEGEKIATIIPGPSACSTGGHLHFEVVKSGVTVNPFSLLSPTSLIWDNIDPEQNGFGSWRWPLSTPIRITQGYGKTSYSSIYVNGIHTGVDMVSTNYSVYAVKEGTLYQGSIACGGGVLSYVHVKHKNDPYDTYYLHVTY